MTYHNNTQLRAWLTQDGIHPSQQTDASAGAFTFDDGAFLAATREVQSQHPRMLLEQCQLRAAYHLLRRERSEPLAGAVSAPMPAAESSAWSSWSAESAAKSLAAAHGASVAAAASEGASREASAASQTHAATALEQRAAASVSAALAASHAQHAAESARVAGISHQSASGFSWIAADFSASARDSAAAAAVSAARTRRSLYIVIALLAAAVILLAVGIAKAAPEPDPLLTANAVSMDNEIHALRSRWKASKLLRPPGLFQFGGNQNFLLFFNGSATVQAGTANPFPVTGSFICTSGCGGAASFSDNSAFTVGTTPINVIGGLYDSGADPAIANGNGGRARIDSHSYLLTDCAVGCSGGATTPTDAFATPTAASLSASFGMAYNGASWDLMRSGDKNNVTGVVGVLNTAPLGRYNATQPTLTDGRYNMLQVGAKGSLEVTNGAEGFAVTVSSGTITAACSTACEVSPTTAANTVSNPFYHVLADNAGHALTFNGTTTTSKFAPDINLLSILGTAPTTAGFLDIKGADGNVFVRQTTGSNLHVQADSGSTTAVTGVVEVAPTGSANTLSNQFFTQITNGTTGASVTASGASPASTVGALVTTPSPNGTGCAGQSLANTSSVAINTASASEVQLVAGSGSTLIYVCHYDFIATTAVTVTLQQASSGTCATLTSMTGPYPAAANGGISAGDGAHVLFKIAAGDQLCLLLGSGVQTSGLVTYAQVNAP